MGEYNGWNNWETWNLFTWVTNEEYTNHTARMVALEGVDALEEWCREYVWLSLGFNSPDSAIFGPATDFINASLSEIDYRELREALIDE